MVRRKQQRHGLTVNRIKHPLYKVRERLMHFCYSISETHKSYPYYRGKGIKVCDEWINDVMSFYNWSMDNGWREGLSIDRIDSNGDYEPRNCRFITRSENSKKARLENNQSGMNASSAKLTDEKVLVIKLLLKLGYTSRKIAEFFGLGKTTIQAINTEKTWKHVKDIPCQ